MLQFFKGILCLAAAIALSAFAWSRNEYAKSAASRSSAVEKQPPDDVRATAARIDQRIQSAWSDRSVKPVLRADHLTLARRASLAIVGSIPSLEEIRWYESQPVESRLTQFVDRLLVDRRFAHVWAEQLAAEWLPDDLATYIVTDRRLRFRYWIADQIDAGRPYDETVRAMLASTGLWTTTPAVNFITAHEADPIQLAARTSRAFLGLRLDCAECHNHPFAAWKQSQFRGLAAFFGRTTFSLKGVTDDGPIYRFDEEKDGGTVVLPGVPYDPPTAASSERLRERLADWVTSKDNPRFGQSIANRIWQKMFARPIVDPVDDLDGKPSVGGVLEILADDFRSHGCDPRRLYRVIAATEAFSLASELDAETTDDQKALFAAYPVTRLSANEMARSLVQISYLRTVNENTGVLARVKAFFDRQDFIRYFQANNDDDPGSVSQRLMLMNGPMVQDRTHSDWLRASGRFGLLASNDSVCVEAAFLTCLTRRPTEEEREHFLGLLAGTKGEKREKRVEDMLWALVNCTDFQCRR